MFMCLRHANIVSALIWFQEDRISETGNEAEVRELTLSAHACFLIKSMSLREEHIREVAVNLLNQIRDRFPQVICASKKDSYSLSLAV